MKKQATTPIFPLALLLAMFSCSDPVEEIETEDAEQSTNTDWDVYIPRDTEVTEADVEADASSPQKAGYREPCERKEDCQSGQCIDDGSGAHSICTKNCDSVDDCGDGFTCTIMGNAGPDRTLRCMPEQILCTPCSQDDDCGHEYDLCVPVGPDTYCARDCTYSNCPKEFTCTDIDRDGVNYRQCLPDSMNCTDCTGTCLNLGVCAERGKESCNHGVWNCGYPETYEEGEEQSCDYLDNNCDGFTDENFDLQTDPLNCGRCGKKCQYNNAVGQCDEGLCSIKRCAYGWVDLNENPADGCEYECTWQNDFDYPDLDNQDANCDGLDGDITRAVFVDGRNGSDSTGDGSREKPYQTINTGILAASGRGHDVYISYGVYREEIDLIQGVSLFGGYDADQNFKRTPTAETKVITNKGLRAIGIDADHPTEIQRLVIEGIDQTTASQNSYALYVKNAPGLIVRDCTISSKNGGTGLDGTNGGSGSNGGAGERGNAANDASHVGAGCDKATGGNGGYSYCSDGNRSGGKGGDGGKDEDDGSRGANGTPYESGVNDGGSGGANANCKSTGNGSTGKNGKNGTNGNDGAGGSGSGRMISEQWVGDAGGNGSNGISGSGGGGGGGGGGQSNSGFGIFQCDIGCAGGGGGGGGGGCGGTAATGGQAGGASIAVLLINSDATFINNTIKSGLGGQGGRGGTGGSGGAGGQAGSGGDSNGSGDNYLGGGGRGGTGGKGGRGGHGGGGSGGASIGIYAYNSNPQFSEEGGHNTNSITYKDGGPGGSSSGKGGTEGIACEICRSFSEGEAPSCENCKPTDNKGSNQK